MGISPGKWNVWLPNGRFPNRLSAPSLTNVGRQPEEETLTLQGTVDLPADLMEMTIWQNGVPDSETGLSVRIENGEAYGRYGENELQPIDNVANLFAPNQDPLGLLASITNIFEGQNGDTIFYDSSGNGNHSEVCSNCPAVVPGLFGNGLDFSEGDLFTVPADESLNVGQEFSIAFWINPDNAYYGAADRFITLGDDKPVVMNNYPAGPDLIVEELNVTGSEIEVVIRNVGDTAVTDEFWVDVYIDPSTPPTAVNQTIGTLNSNGAVWGITDDVLPLLPGESLVLTLHDAYYVAAYSQLKLPVVVGTAVYAQVDSANAGTTYGGVLESHERINTSYNNILQEIAE